MKKISTSTKLCCTSIFFFVLLFVFYASGISPAKSVDQPQQTQENVVILMYHDLRFQQLGKDSIPAWCTTDLKFREDLQVLLDLGLFPLSLEQYISGNYDPEKRYFIITFDDGYLSNYTIAYPILKSLGIHGDIFAVTDSIGTLDNHFTFAQAQEMEDSGYVTIHSHTCNHLSFAHSNVSEFTENVLRSLKVLRENLTEGPLRGFAYPNGAYSREIAESLSNAGVAFQMVQASLADDSQDPLPSGLLYRISIGYDSDVRQMVIDFFEQYGKYSQPIKV